MLSPNTADGKTIVAGATNTDEMLRIMKLNTDGIVDLNYWLSGIAVRSTFPSIAVFGLPL